MFGGSADSCIVGALRAEVDSVVDDVAKADGGDGGLSCTAPVLGVVVEAPGTGVGTAFGTSYLSAVGVGIEVSRDVVGVLARVSDSGGMALRSVVGDTPSASAVNRMVVRTAGGDTSDTKASGGLSAAGREPTVGASPATAEGIVSAGSLRVAGCVALAASAGVADATGGGVLAGGERGTPAQIGVRDSVDVPSSVGVERTFAGASISSAELACRTGVMSAAGREPTAGGTVPSDVADVMVSGSIADVEVGLGFSAATDELVGVSPLAAADRVVAASLPPATADPPGWPGCDGIAGQFDDVGIGGCAVLLDGAENMGGTAVYSELVYSNGSEATPEQCTLSRGCKRAMYYDGGCGCRGGVAGPFDIGTDLCHQLDRHCVAGQCDTSNGPRLDTYATKGARNGEITPEGCVVSCHYMGRSCRCGDCVLRLDGVEAAGATTTDRGVPNYMPYDESLMTELGAPVVGMRALIVEPTNSIRFWGGGDRRYSSVSWETYALCLYVWGRVRSILLLVVQVSPNNTRFGVRAESWGTKFSAPRRRRAGNAYVMTSSVERVEVLAGVLIVPCISYGKVSTAEVMVEVDSIDLLSCGAGVAADARACVYRLYGVERRRETRMEEVEA